ncbi:hypothetical protein V1520DRAFT_324630 [Lipomyces starkeyi]|uniref:Magnesium transporter n=1 Tax=Lipomyces starkeyi NRRL Y-11557 TaxID=675824 RepID=A0A1E3QB08_LIPST|nr:hypothetical protein LIPSTDRAFT_1637 [Lipomyces starkeyi NRRL Y-11557]
MSPSPVSTRQGSTIPRACRDAGYKARVQGHSPRVCSRWFHSCGVGFDMGPLRSKLGPFLLSSATSSVHAAAEPASKLESRDPVPPRRAPVAEAEREGEETEKTGVKKEFLTEDVGVSGRELRALLLNRRRDILAGQVQRTDTAPKSPASSASSARKITPDSQIQNTKVKDGAKAQSAKPTDTPIKETTQDQIRTLFKSISIAPSSPKTPPPQPESTEHLTSHKTRTRKWNRSAIEELLLERSLVHKATTAGNLVRCTVFDLEGTVTVVSGEFKKSELLSKHGLLPRDLRKLDTGSYTTMPSILVRNNSILINLLHIRALIKADMVLIFDAYGSTDSQTQSVFMYDLEGKLRQGSKAMGGLPYEMRALEAILISVVTALDAEMKIHTTIVTGILADLENNIDREKLRHLLVQSKALAQFLQKATLVRDAINEVLEQDDDLAGMYLSEKLNGIARPHDQHSEVEMLLESYYKHCDEIVQAANITMSNVRTTEEIVNIILDANRNSLMLLELKFTIGALGLGGGALVAALYGMNLKNFMEDSGVGFWTISAFASAVVGAIIVVGLKNLRKVQRVTMMWEHGADTGHGSGGSSSCAPRGAPVIRPIVVVGKSARQKSRFWR